MCVSAQPRVVSPVVVVCDPPGTQTDKPLLNGSPTGGIRRGASIREAAETWAAAGFLPAAEAAAPEQPIALDLSAGTILLMVWFFEFTSPARTLQVTARPG